ncbi:myosin-2 heavy chain isoform X1 [Vigna radiata var. radiata]|uniref:Myosin-2 heavy chain isoform X1 n=2 Tax=Vigna radiata var. radiata TaxID=3916 RepID=A0A1S3VSW8_VIGRR|nr:myosin-2 heavy chain isoform X1 [Vigna radiata var. radiata]
MAESSDDEPLLARIEQLERERDELHKDIEQLCMQQAGPGYLAVATRMHFQRTAGLEQEIESLKKKLAACSRDNLNLEEELSEAYRIKGQLADLHSAEVSKNMEAEKQVKFFQGCMATAFAERDQAIIEAEKAKEKEETMFQQIHGFHQRVEELTADCLKLKEFNDALQIDQAVHMKQNENFKKVINKFFQIRQPSVKEFEDTSWDEKCACLLGDPEEAWSFNDPSTSKYVSALEEHLERLRNSMDYLQNKLRVGLEIENHLKKRVNVLEKKQISMDKLVQNGIADLKSYHSECRDEIMNLLGDGESIIKSITNVIDEKIRSFDLSTVPNLTLQRDAELEESEGVGIHISPQAKPISDYERNSPRALSVGAGLEGDASNVLAMALQEKVDALLLLSQQEERHLLERNVNSALQGKTEELQRNLMQVTNEKVKALMELAQLKQEYQLLLEKLGDEPNQEKGVVNTGDRKLVTRERDGTLKNLLKKSYLRRWIAPLNVSVNEVDSSSNNEGKTFNHQSSGSIDFARMKIENATLKESMESMEHLTSSIHRLRLSLSKAKDCVTSEGTISGVSEILSDVIHEAELLRTALGSSLPTSWPVEADISYIGYSMGTDRGDHEGSDEKMDTVSAAGLEMVELLIFSAQTLRDLQTKIVFVPGIEVL